MKVNFNVIRKDGPYKRGKVVNWMRMRLDEAIEQVSIEQVSIGALAKECISNGEQRFGTERDNVDEWWRKRALPVPGLDISDAAADPLPMVPADGEMDEVEKGMEELGLEGDKMDVD